MKPRYALVSWNVNSLRVRLAHLISLIQTHQPDIICLQETKVVDELFPSASFDELGYGAFFSGQKTYNGVAILYRKESSIPIDSSVNKDLVPNDPQRRFISSVFGTSLGQISIASVYIPNGQAVQSDAYFYKLQWLSHLKEWAKQQSKNGPLFILGDFNIAPSDQDVYDPVAWKEQILCSTPEREAFEQLLTTGLVDTVAHLQRKNPSLAIPFTWWDYRQASFQRNRGLRIDHVLTNAESLLSQQTYFVVDTQTRSLEKPSDHAPVFLNID